MKICLITNQQAGTAQSLRESVEDFIRRSGCRQLHSGTVQQAEQQARQALEEGFERIVVAGGDGTISRVINAIAPDFSAVELAVLPLGTGNDLARSLGVHADDFRQACHVATGTHVASIDLVRLTTRNAASYFVNSANGGFGGQVAIDVRPGDKKRWGAFAYWLTAINESAHLQPFQLQLELDGQTRNVSVYGLTVANGRYAGGGFAIAPRALLNDGFLDLTLIPVLSMLELISAGASFAMGLTEAGRIQVARAQRVSLVATPEMSFSVDGEPAVTKIASFEVVPGAVRFAVGPDAALQ